MGLFRFLRPASPNTKRRGRLWRWVLRPLASLAAVVALVLVGAQVLLHSLEAPWLKARLQRLARTSAGVEIDYRTARVDLLSGAAIEGLVVESPEEVRRFAAELVRVGRLDATWSLGALLRHDGPVLTQLAVSGVTLGVVVDENGRSSFDALAKPGPAPRAGPPVPLSQQASNLLAGALPLGRLGVDHVTLVLVQTSKGTVVDRTELRGLGLALATGLAAKPATGASVEAQLGSMATPLDLELAREHEGVPVGAAKAKLWMQVDATSLALTAAIDLRMVDQTFAASVSADRWLHAEARLRFDPAAARTEITIDHTSAGDGAATAEASIELPDVGDPVVRSAHGDIDVARLLRWLPAGIVPVTAERAQVRYQIGSLVAGSVPRLEDGGALDVEAELAQILVTGPGGPIQVGTGQVTVHAQPADMGGMAGRGSVKIGRLSLANGEDRLTADEVAVDFDGQRTADGVIGGHLGVRWGRMDHGLAARVVAQGGQVDLRVQGVQPNAGEPLATRGDIGLAVQLSSLDVRSAAMHAIADGVTLHAHTVLEGHLPYAAQTEARVSRLRATGRTGAVLADAPVRLDAWARDVRPDAVHPASSRGVVHAAVELGELSASIDTTKAADALDYTLEVTAKSLRAVRPLLPPDLGAASPWDRMASTVHSSGHVENLGGGSPFVRHTTELRVERPAYTGVAARSLVLTLKSQGTVLRHEADVDLRVPGLALAGGAPSDDHVTLEATVDRERRSLQFKLGADGRATTKLSGSLSFDATRRAVVYDIVGSLAGLGPLAPLAARVRGLDAFDLSQMEVGLEARGAVVGVVAAVSPDGTITLEPKPSQTAAVMGTTDLRVAHFHWTKGDTAILTPSLAWHGVMRVAGARRTLESQLEVGTLHLDLGIHDVDLNGVHDQGTFAFVGDLEDPQIEASEHIEVHGVTQDLVPEYPLGDLAFGLTAQRGPEGVIHVTELKIANGLGGTALGITGNVDLGEGRHSLSVTTSLTQDLLRLSTIPDRFRGRGKVAVEANVTSPDLAIFEVRAAVKGENVNLTLPRASVDVENANGEVPVTVSLEVGPRGVALQRSERGSAYSMLRFADQHPLLSRSGFLSITRLQTPFASIAPLVGNLEIDQNVISLRQFEMGVRGGRITGQCAVDWKGAKSTLEFHIRATGVQSTHGEPFDGNIAVAISAADRTIEGRAEILRIGERHLLDLLDLQDPQHVDPAMNRIRTALRVGYPDSLRLVFDHGFASAHLELGGLARLISIGELRGIPMGPIIDKMLAPVLDGPGTKEAL